MPRIQAVQTSFADGQISPRMQGYVDLPSYKSSLKVCENYIPLPQGSVTRRPGTFFVSKTKDNADVRLVPFNFGQGESYVLEFGNLYVRFYRTDNILTAALPANGDISSVNTSTQTITLSGTGHGLSVGDDVYLTLGAGAAAPGGLITGQRYFIHYVSGAAIRLSLADNVLGTALNLTSAGSGTRTFVEPYQELTTYTTSDLDDLFFTQSADVLFISHPDFAPRELKRTADTNWVLSTLTLKDGPYKPVNTETTTVTVSRNSVDAEIKTLVDADVNVSTNRISVVNHGLVDGQTVKFTGSDLPAYGSGSDTFGTESEYFVVNATLDDFKMATTYGGTALDITDVGTGTRKIFYKDYGFELIGEISGANADYTDHSFTMVAHPLVNGQQIFYRGGEGEQTATFVNGDVDASADTITINGHELENGNVVKLTTTNTLPTGLSTSATYYVVDKAANTIKLSLTKGGEPVDITGVTSTGPPTHTISFSGIQSLTAGTLYYVVAATTNTFKLSTDKTGDPVEWIGSVSKDIKFFKKFIPKNSKVTLTFSSTTGINDDVGFSASSGNSDVGRIIRINSEIAPQIMWGYATVDSVTSTTVVVCTVNEHLAYDGSSTEWALGSFSESSGFPRCVQIFQQRLVFAGTLDEPQTVHFSKSGDFDNFASSEPLGVQTGKFNTSGASIMGEQIYSDNAISLMISSDTVDKIEWLQEGRRLTIGTSGGVFQMFGNRDDTTVTPFSFSVEKISNWAAHTSALPAAIGNNMVYVQKNGRKIRELVFDREQEQYEAKDITLRAEDITQSGIKEMFFQDQPASVLWGTRTDGKLISCTYILDLNMTSWAIHSIGGSQTDATYGNHSKVEKVCVIPRETTDRGSFDQLWMTVKRDVDEYFTQFPYTAITDGTDKITINSHDMANGTAVKITTDGTMPTNLTSGTTYYVRATDTNDFELAAASGGSKIEITQGSGTHTIYKVDQTQRFVEFMEVFYDNSMAQSVAHYVDCGSSLSGSSPVSTVSGLDYIDGETVSILGDDAVQPDKTIVAGSITPQFSLTTARIGLAYNSSIQTLPLAVGNVETMTSIGNKKRIHRIVVKILDTLGLKYGLESDDLTAEIFRRAGDAIGSSLSLFTGDRNLAMPGIFDTEGKIYLRQDQPYPSTITMIAIDYETNE